ncbi:uncharacterized protein PgNI_12086 [Pyricularia grisea]|uniref:Uncharacterized protein n=1 Tax=Pyricularia grisea TaxID=148305 RepID=A0A6P8AQW9_PYRGI|nr:uncharacterized protein PgNI_12086 [Pyricularia grisea]TLD04457.1 hypothetical protein PgNI_12086 [Pyricularia grisea]
MVKPIYIIRPFTYYGPKRYRRRGYIPRHKLIIILMLKPFLLHIGKPFSLRFMGNNTGWILLYKNKSAGRNIPGNVLGNTTCILTAISQIPDLI